MTYIHELKTWPEFTWDNAVLENILAKVKNKQELVRAYMQSFGLSKKGENLMELETLILDVIKTTEIEGEKLDPEKVRSSLARRLGLEVAGLVPSPRNVDGVVEMMVDATQKYNLQLTKERLCGWQAALFPTGRNLLGKITVGRWRIGEQPMQVVSGEIGREKVHYEAPDASTLESQMGRFLDWFNTENSIDPLLKAAIAHFWFVTIHPFEDGNGRIARAIGDMQLSRADDDSKRFYSMSTQIEAEKKRYYDILEKTQKGTLDITEWLEWFLNCLDRALSKTKTIIDKVMEKARFWASYNHIPVNTRQTTMINKLLDGFDGKLNSSKWAKIGKCSADTALRDIQDLIDKGMLMKGHSGSKNTYYILTPLLSSRKNLEYDLTNMNREVKFSIETPDSYIEIKKIILIPL
jgi:Fic family protein